MPIPKQLGPTDSVGWLRPADWNEMIAYVESGVGNAGAQTTFVTVGEGRGAPAEYATPLYLDAAHVLFAWDGTSYIIISAS